MSDLIAVAYADRATAEKVRDELARLTRERRAPRAGPSPTSASRTA